jgi:hypothetical protein
MDTLKNNFDGLEQLIYSEGIKIKAVDIHKDMDIWLIILNTGFVLKEKLSRYFQLSQATNKQLLNFQLIGNGAAIHWPDLDEYLSLKGFLRDNIKSLVVGDRVA